MPLTTRFQKTLQNGKKKPPPRPPPPNFNKYKSKSTLNLNQNNQNVNLMEFNSPPNSPKTERNHHFGGSISSSFSSSTSSLASSKKSFEFDSPTSSNPWPLPSQQNTLWPVQNNPPQQNTNACVNSNFHQLSNHINGPTFQSYLLPPPSTTNKTVSSLMGPTIIRAQSTKKLQPIKTMSNENNKTGLSNILTNAPPSPPMPTIPPPSPPKIMDDDVEPPYGIALYDFEATLASDLAFQADDIVILLNRVNGEWLHGKVLDKEGIFPENYIEIKVPLKGEENIVKALYEFQPQMNGDLALKPGQKVMVTRKVSDEWLYGQTELGEGQFPANYVNRVPKNFR